MTVDIDRAGQGDLVDRLALGQRERRWSATRVARVERVEPIIVEIIDHISDPVSTGERHLAIPAMSVL